MKSDNREAIQSASTKAIASEREKESVRERDRERDIERDRERERERVWVELRRMESGKKVGYLWRREKLLGTERPRV